MELQKQIKRTLTRPEAIELIRSALDSNDNINRTQLADQVCGHYGFFDARGALQRSSCLKALRELEQRDHFVLPVSLTQPGQKSPRCPGEPIVAANGVPAEAGDVRGLQLIVVETVEQMRIWNELMIRGAARAEDAHDLPSGAGVGGAPAEGN